MEFQEKLYDFVLENYESEESSTYFDSPIQIAYFVSAYAHRNQTRQNGDPYFSHPHAVTDRYRKLIGADGAVTGKAYTDILTDVGIPFYGTDEVCLLHDVIEDTDVTMENLLSVFRDNGYGIFFIEAVAAPLDAITHRKGEADEDYFKRVLANETASLVKMMDLSDNLNLLTLTAFTEKEHKRAEKYLREFRAIEETYHFLEKGKAAREKMKHADT